MDNPLSEPTYYMKPWQRYGLYLLLIIGEVFSGYMLYKAYLQGSFSFTHPFFLNLVLGPLILLFLANRTYYFEGKTFVSNEFILTREIALPCVKYVKVDKQSIRLHKIPLLFSPVIYKYNQRADEVAACLDEILLDHSDIPIKGSFEHIERWFPKTFETRTKHLDSG